MEETKSELPWYQRIDKTIFGLTMGLVVLFFGWALIAGEQMGTVMQNLFNVLTDTFGWFYLLLGLLFVIFAFWLALGPYGNVKLGEEDDEPEYSYFSWFAMLFACGYGVGIVFWGAAEPLTFFANSAPMGVETGTAAAAENALSYAFFHWGWTPWAIYLACGLPLSYFMYKRNMEPRFSSALKPLVGDKYKGIAGKLLDSALVMAVVGAITTSLGLGIMQLTAGLDQVLGIPRNTFMYLVVAIAWVALFGASAISGVDKGIKKLSDINIPLALVIMVFVFFAGPSLFSLDLGIQAFGNYLSNFFEMSLRLAPIEDTGFPQAWTIFYWAWWFSAAPATGLFVARISKGRTIREVVVAHMVTAPVATWAWFLTFGGSSIFYQQNGMDLAATLAESGKGAVVYTLLEQLPLSTITGVGFMLLIFIFLSTTADSFSYVCAQVSTKRDCNPRIPPKGIRASYAAIVGVAAIVLVLYGKGITGLQLTSIITSFLVTFIMVAMNASLVKSLQEDRKRKEQES